MTRSVEGSSVYASNDTKGTMTEFKWFGTVSHGTMRDEDLIPAFIGVLHDIDPVRSETFYKKFPSYPDAVDFSNDDGGDEAASMTAWLFDELDAMAPDGYYFGAIEGDGSDYGFWAVD